MARPWNHFTEQYDAISPSVWNDLNGFENWLSAELEKDDKTADDFYEWWNGTRCGTGAIFLYTLFCKAYDVEEVT